VISGNQRFGIWIFGALSTGNLVQGNFIGTDLTGTANLGNSHDGVLIQQGPVGNTIGGTTTAARNVISGNGGFVVSIGLATSNVVQGNFIGTDVTGAKALGNSQGGVFIQDAASNTIGGATATARNIISGNTGNRITIDGSTATANLLQGNFIGTDVTGTLARGNSGNRVQIASGATNNTTGGTVGGAGNLIAANNANGIFITGSGTSANPVLGNFIGTNAAGTVALGNTLDGISLSDASNNRIIGNVVSGNGINQDAAEINLESNDRNVISGNGQFPVADLSTQGGVGVYIYGANTSGNVVQRNYIGTNAAGIDALTNSVIGVLISQSSGNTVQGNLISGNRFVGLEIAGGAGGTATGNLVQGNLIGTNAGGTTAIPNGLDGVFINDAPNNTIGGTAAGAGNLISGNGSVGIQLFGPLTQGNVIQGNALGLDSAGRSTLPNPAGGIFVNTGPLNNTIGGTAPGQANRGQIIPLYTVSGSQQSNPGSTAQAATAAGRRFRIRGRARTSPRAHSTAH
jgi:titin